MKRPTNAESAERARQIIALRLGSPKRADPGRPVAAQADVNHCPLFVAANEPAFL